MTPRQRSRIALGEYRAEHQLLLSPARDWSLPSRPLVTSVVVVGQEDLFEVGVLGRDVDQLVLSRPRPAAASPSCPRMTALDPRSPRRGRRAPRGRPRNPRDRPAASTSSSTLRIPLERRLDTVSRAISWPVPDDPDPVGDPLHLGERVAGQEHGSALAGHLPHHGLELPLHQWVKAGAGLVHDQTASGRFMNACDQPHLLPVARGQVTDLLVELGTEPVGQLVDVGPVHPAAQVREVGQGVLAGEVRVERQVGGQVADVPADLHRLVRGSPSRGSTHGPRSAGSRRARCGSWSSCPLRWVPGSRRPHRVGHRG